MYAPRSRAKSHFNDCDEQSVERHCLFSRDINHRQVLRRSVNPSCGLDGSLSNSDFIRLNTRIDKFSECLFLRCLLPLYVAKWRLVGVIVTRWHQCMQRQQWRLSASVSAVGTRRTDVQLYEGLPIEGGRKNLLRYFAMLPLINSRVQSAKRSLTVIITEFWCRKEIEGCTSTDCRKGDRGLLGVQWGC